MPVEQVVDAGVGVQLPLAQPLDVAGGQSRHHVARRRRVIGVVGVQATEVAALDARLPALRRRPAQGGVGRLACDARNAVAGADGAAGVIAIARIQPCLLYTSMPRAPPRRII